MVKISFKRKEFYIQLRKEPVSIDNRSPILYTSDAERALHCWFWQSESYDTLLGFGMFSHKKAKALWKSCVEHHSFFRLERPSQTPRFLSLSLGSRFYYSGRTEVQAVQESRHRAKVAKVFARSPSKRHQSASLYSLSSPKSTSSGTDHNDKAFLRAVDLSKTYRTHSDSHRVTDAANTLPRKAWEQQSDE